MTPKQQIREEIVRVRDAQRELNTVRETISLRDMEEMAPNLINSILSSMEDMITENVWQILPDREWLYTKLVDYVDWEEAVDVDVDPTIVVDHILEMWHLDDNRIWHEEYFRRDDEEEPFDDDDR
jgi:hypothetical protein